MRTVCLLLALVGLSAASQPRPALKPSALKTSVAAKLNGETGSYLVAARAPPPSDTAASTAVLLAKGLPIALLPYVILCAVFVDSPLDAAVAVLSDIEPMALLTTFGTYVLADTLSNWIQHPTHNMDYGAVNGLLGREVGDAFWGTRTEHIVGVALGLAVVDHFSQGFFEALLGKTVFSFAEAPGTFVAHTMFFIFSGVAAYSLFDCAFNPQIATEDRWDAYLSEVYNTVVGTSAAWFEPWVAIIVGKLLGAAAGDSWAGGSLLPATLAYAAVKGQGWFDWGADGLTEHEEALNK